MLSVSATSLAHAFSSGGRPYVYHNRYRKFDLSGYVLAFLDEKDLRVIPCLNRSWKQLMAPRFGLPRLTSEDYLPGSHDEYRIKRSLHRNEAEAILKQTGVEIPFPTGENFLEHYSLGKGAFGEFCIGYAMQKTHYVGIKITLGQRAVESEAKIQQALSKQPHIMPAIDTYKAINPNGKVAFYQVMDLAGLGSADKLPLAKLDKKFREHVLFCLADGLLQGLNEMHRQGFCHLDIKPENLAVKNDGTVRLIDFGCSAMMQSQMIDVREENGDSRYFSPERWLGCRAAKASQTHGPKIDAWAAGLTLLVLAQADFKTENTFIGMQDLLTSRNAEEALHRYVRAQLAKIPALKDPARDHYEALVLELLNPDPSKRLSPAKALDHPWCKRMRLEYSAQREVVGYLREFVQEHQRLRKLEPGTDVLSPQDLPLPHFTSFVERPSLQNQIEKALFSVGFTSFFTKTPVLACSGIGGVGKSRLLTYMIHTGKIQNHFGLRLWFYNADDREKLVAQYVALAKELYLVDDSCSSDEAIKKVHEHLALYPKRSGKPWLIVFDHAGEPEQLASFIPSKGGYCVITTRSLKWKDALAVDVLSQRESEILVKKLLLRTDPQSGELCKEMGNHPLGIEQACALIRDQQMTISMYLERLRKDISTFSNNKRLFGKEMPHSIDSLWKATFEIIKNSSKEAYVLLETLSFFASTNLIPELLSVCAPSDVQNILTRYGVLQANVNGSYTINRLIQLAMIYEQNIETQILDTLPRSMKCFLHAYYSVIGAKKEGQLLVHGESLLKHFERLSSPKKLLSVSIFIKQLLVKQLSFKSNPTYIDNEGRNGLHRAVIDGNLVAIPAILFTHEHLLKSITNERHTPLLVAAASGNREAYEMLLQAGANSKATGNHGHNALHLAAISGKTELVQLLAEDKELLEAIDDDGFSPLLLAAFWGRREVYEILLKAGGNPIATNNFGDSVLHQAIVSGNLALVQLIAANKELLEAKDKKGITPLLLAVSLEHTGACEILLKAGANPMVIDSFGGNVLHCAARFGYPKLVQLLATYKELLEARNDTFDTPLFLAATNGHREAFEMLLKMGANHKAMSNEDHTVLHRAAVHGKTEIVQLFAKHKELLEARDKNGDTPLLLAASQGHRETCEMLLKMGANPKAMSNEDHTVLHHAVKQEKTEIVQLFAKYKELHEARDKNGNTPLLLAAQWGNRKVCEMLLTMGANLKAIDNNANNGLHIATWSGKTEVMQFFAANKELLEGKDKEGNTPLFFAIAWGARVACEILLNAGANPRAINNFGSNMLHVAAARGVLDVVQLLAKNKELLEAEDFQSKSTPLLVAVYSGHRKACEILLKAGANSMAIDSLGRNVLHYAAVSQKEELIRLFIGNQDLLNARDVHGDTPLLVAACYGDRKICEMLLDAGAKPMATNKKGCNALHIATANGKAGVVSLLAKNKKLLEARDEQGFTPLLTAVNFGDRGIYETLLKAGVDLFKRNDQCRNALHVAAASGKAGVVSLLAEEKELLEEKDRGYCTPLLLAAYHGHREVCEILLKKGANLKATDIWRYTVLHFAAEQGNTEVVQLFAKYQELLAARDMYENTPLLVASSSGHRETCEILLKAGANPEATSQCGRNVLHVAAAKGKIKVLNLFAEHTKFLESRDKDGNMPLHLAAAFGHREVCQILLKAGANSLATNQGGRNVLHQAAMSGKTEIVQLFAENKELLEARDLYDGNTPLLLAAYFGHCAVYEMLLKAGANSKVTNRRECNALHIAIMQRKTEVVRLLAANKELLEAKGDWSGNTPLLLAVEIGRQEVYEILLKEGANPHAINNNGDNALHKAAICGRAEFVELVAENKELIEAKNKDGDTPLLCAARYGHDTIYEMLLKVGANPKATNKLGRNALHVAAEGGKKIVVRLLAANKELLEARDTERGYIPLHLAAEFGHREVCEILLQAGADPKATDKDGRNALYLAAKKGKTEVVRLLAKNKELLEAIDMAGYTPLLSAVEDSRREESEILLKAGANPKVTNTHGYNALHLAALHGKTKVLQLLAANKELHEAKDSIGYTPLLLAAHHGHREACELLLKAGANPKEINDLGRNALHVAVAQGKTEVVRLFTVHKELLEVKEKWSGDTPLLLSVAFGHRVVCELLLGAGADPKAINNYGHNVLHIAAERGHTEFMKFFTKYKELLEARDKDGHTPLLLAAHFGHCDVCEILLKAGADSKAKNKLGQNALQLAQLRKHEDIVRLLTS